jgi:hypothetical protein
MRHSELAVRTQAKKPRPNWAGAPLAIRQFWASALHDIATVEPPVLLDLIGGVRRQIVVEGLPPSGAIRLTARLEID